VAVAVIPARRSRLPAAARVGDRHPPSRTSLRSAAARRLRGPGSPTRCRWPVNVLVAATALGTSAASPARQPD